jgi:hypothetical protein
MTLVAAFTLLGCASGGSSSNPQPENPIELPPENPIEPTPSNPIEEDNSKAITIDGDKVYVDGEEYGTIVGSFVYNSDGDLVGSITRDHDGTNAWYVFSPNEGGGYYFQVQDGRVVINWERSIIDEGWGAPAPDKMRISPEWKARARQLKAQAQGRLKK